MSGCIYVDCDDAPEFYRAETVRARKAHRCLECGETINPGDLYERAVGKWDGGVSTAKTCARCLLVRADYFENTCHGSMVDDFAWTHGVDYRKGIPAHVTPCRGQSNG